MVPASTPTRSVKVSRLVFIAFNWSTNKDIANNAVSVLKEEEKVACEEVVSFKVIVYPLIKSVILFDDLVMDTPL